MRRRRDLTGWILMAVLFIGAMSLIFYILLMRAQHLASMEDRRENPDGEAVVQLMAVTQGPAIVMHSSREGVDKTPHKLVIVDQA